MICARRHVIVSFATGERLSLIHTTFPVLSMGRSGYVSQNAMRKTSCAKAHLAVCLGFFGGELRDALGSGVHVLFVKRINRAGRQRNGSALALSHTTKPMLSFHSSSSKDCHEMVTPQTSFHSSSSKDCHEMVKLQTSFHLLSSKDCHEMVSHF